MKNQYPEFISDGVSSQMVRNPLHVAFQEGYEARVQEEINESRELFEDYSADAAMDDWKRDQVAKEREE